MALVSGPAVAMILLAAAVKISMPPVLFVSAMQHLAAGIVLSAVAVELVPIISEAESTSANIFGITLGFTAGVALFITVGKFCEADFDDDDDDCEDGGHSHGHSHATGPKVEATKSLRRMTSKVNQMKKTLSGSPGGGRVATYEAIQSQASTASGPSPYPTTLVLAVMVDACVDGFLIGLSAASGTNAGLIMAIALTIEMAFLSLTFSATLRNQKLHVFVVSVLLPPLALWGGGLIGCTTATVVAASPALHVGLISFGIAALLYLVTEELLLEAHESQGGEEHIWWVDATFFFGFLLSFLMDKLLE